MVDENVEIETSEDIETGTEENVVDDHKLAFTPIELTVGEKQDEEKLAQLKIDNELQRRVKDNEAIYEAELIKLKGYGLKFELKGGDPIGINGTVFSPNTIYTIGNRIHSPDGIQLITYDIMQSVLSADSAAVVNEGKIKQAGGGTMEVTEHGGVILTTTRT